MCHAQIFMYIALEIINFHTSACILELLFYQPSDIYAWKQSFNSWGFFPLQKYNFSLTSVATVSALKAHKTEESVDLQC